MSKTVPRHRKAVRRHPLRAVFITLAALIVLAVGFWFTPASLLPGDVRVCTVTGGGTMRVETRQCGTLLVRGHADVRRGEDYAFHTLGPVALEWTRAGEVSL